MSFSRLVSLIILCNVFCLCVLTSRDTRGSSTPEKELSFLHSPTTSPSVAPSPVNQSTSKAKAPNAVRRFFSWAVAQLARPFRKKPRYICTLPPTIYSISTSKSLITFCPTATIVSSNLNCAPDREVKLVANAVDPDGDTGFLYTWTVNGGTIRGDGREVTWDLSGLAEGSYTATVGLNDGNQHTASGSTTVTIALCSGCDRPPPLCPSVSVSCPSEIGKEPITFVAIVAGGDPEMQPTYSWSVTAGKIISGQGTSRLMVDIADLGGRSITATVSLGGAHPACTPIKASCTISHLVGGEAEAARCH